MCHSSQITLFQSYVRKIPYKITGLFLKGKVRQDTDKSNKCKLKENSMEVSPNRDVDIKRTGVAEDSQSASDNHSEPPL